MKKLIAVSLAAFFICGNAVSADKFLGWKSTDLAKMKEQIKKSDTDVPIVHKIAYLLNIARAENPTSVDTFEKTFKFIQEKFPAMKESEIFLKIVQYKRCRNESDFTADILKHKLANDNYYINVYYKLSNPKAMGVSITKDEIKALALKLYPEFVEKNQIPLAKIALDKYITISYADDDAEVVKNLKAFYRLTLPKVPENEKWKPLIVKISISLKARGVEIK